MDQCDQAAAAAVLREMSSAGVSLDELAAKTGLNKKTLWRRLTEGSFEVRELGLIANVLNCTTADLVAEVAA
ncbi:helix-turn-helix domain-containing protein [Nocardia sp. NPDC049149]|uniref:helix-turn-helix domain-containing protein n=1 Tax=Nocardia sp. NPDC049149 TaxID=3364315 RepID=UPI0037142471